MPAVVVFPVVARQQRDARALGAHLVAHSHAAQDCPPKDKHFSAQLYETADIVKLEQYAAQEQHTAWADLIGDVTQGGAEAISASTSDGAGVNSEALDHAAIESGTD